MLLLKLIEILPNIGSHSSHIRALRFVGTKRKVLEGGGSEALDEGSEVISDAELLELLRRGGGRGGGGGSGGGGNGGELGRNRDGVGEGLDLVCLAKRGGFEDVGLLGGFGGELLRFLGGFGDEIGDPGGGRGQGLGFLRGLFGEGLRALPQVLHCRRRREKQERKKEKGLMMKERRKKSGD